MSIELITAENIAESITGHQVNIKPPIRGLFRKSPLYLVEEKQRFSKTTRILAAGVAALFSGLALTPTISAEQPNLEKQNYTSYLISARDKQPVRGHVVSFYQWPDSFRVNPPCASDITDVDGGFFLDCVVGIDEDNKKNINFNIGNYPNPFSTKTFFNLNLEERSEVNLDIFDLSGRLIRTLVDANLNEGNYKYRWDGIDNNDRKVSNGIYFYRFKVNGKNINGKLVFIKGDKDNNNSNLNLEQRINYGLASPPPLFFVAEGDSIYTPIFAYPNQFSNPDTVFTIEGDIIDELKLVKEITPSFPYLSNLKLWDTDTINISLPDSIDLDTLFRNAIKAGIELWNQPGKDLYIKVISSPLPDTFGWNCSIDSTIPRSWGLLVLNRYVGDPAYPTRGDVLITPDLREVADSLGIPHLSIAKILGEKITGKTAGGWVVAPSDSTSPMIHGFKPYTRTSLTDPELRIYSTVDGLPYGTDMRPYRVLP